MTENTEDEMGVGRRESGFSQVADVVQEWDVYFEERPEQFAADYEATKRLVADGNVAAFLVALADSTAAQAASAAAGISRESGPA